MRGFCLRIAFLLLVAISFVSNAADRQPYQIRASLILHVLNYTTFPIDNDPTQSFNLCFLESGDYQHASMLISSKLKGKQINNALLNVIKLDNINDVTIQQCRAIFIARESESADIFDALKLLPTDVLTIGESNRFVEQSGLLAIVFTQSKMKIVINKTLLEESTLKISSRLLRLAKFI